MSRSRPRISDGWLIAFGTWIAEAGAEMPDRFTAFRSWVTFAGCVLVVAVLYWAQAVLVPVALSILISFVLTPPVLSLQRRIGRLPAILLVVTLVSRVSAWLPTASSGRWGAFSART